MAKLYNFHIYSNETGQEKEIEEFESSKIQIANEFGEETFNQLKKMFVENSDVAIANNVEPPGERGGGGLGIFPLMDWIYIGLTITVILTTKGFFDEFGRELARKLIRGLFDKERTTKLVISSDKERIEIIIPAKTKGKDVVDLEHFLDNQNNIEGGKYVYSSEEKKFILIEKYEDFNGKG